MLSSHENSLSTMCIVPKLRRKANSAIDTVRAWLLIFFFFFFFFFFAKARKETKVDIMHARDVLEKCISEFALATAIFL